MTILGLNCKSRFYQNLMKQSFILSIIMLVSSLNFEGLGFAIITLVSSANRVGYDGSATIFGRSFI